eukprot:Rhum_TRINITY_DN14711_c0_g1::Rhum_TRINITY_DN14711_c0_g1_i1::g.111583::m.111583
MLLLEVQGHEGVHRAVHGVEAVHSGHRRHSSHLGNPRETCRRAAHRKVLHRADAADSHALQHGVAAAPGDDGGGTHSVEAVRKPGGLGVRLVVRGLGVGHLRHLRLRSLACGLPKPSRGDDGGRVGELLGREHLLRCCLQLGGGELQSLAAAARVCLAGRCALRVVGGAVRSGFLLLLGRVCPPHSETLVVVEELVAQGVQRIDSGLLLLERDEAGLAVAASAREEHVAVRDLPVQLEDLGDVLDGRHRGKIGHVQLVRGLALFRLLRILVCCALHVGELDRHLLAVAVGAPVAQLLDGLLRAAAVGEGHEAAQASAAAHAVQDVRLGHDAEALKLAREVIGGNAASQVGDIELAALVRSNTTAFHA